MRRIVTFDYSMRTEIHSQAIKNLLEISSNFLMIAVFIIKIFYLFTFI